MGDTEENMPTPHLRSAPITEAVLEIRAPLPDGVDVADLKAFTSRFAPDYVIRNERVQLAVPMNDPTQATKKIDGILFEHSTQPYVLQCRLDGFALSRLRPYETWDPFQSEAERMWNLFRDTFRPAKATRLGLRYINAIEVELWEKASDVLCVLPTVPDSVAPSGFTSFTVRFTTEYPDFGATAAVLEHLAPVAENAKTATIVLDIDVHKLVDGDAGNPRIWRHFAELRELKDLIFFSSVTPAALKRYE